MTHESRMISRPYLILLFIVLFLMTGCGSSSQVDREQKKWKGLGIEDYRITILLYENFANNIQTQREVTVQNGQVVDSSCVADKCPLFALANVYTVDDLFAVARGSTLDTLGMSHDYDVCVKDLVFEGTYGFPRSMSVDCPDAVDEEHSFQVISFFPYSTNTPPAPTITPEYPGTFEMDLHGMVHDQVTSYPIEGARIRYEVVHSYFPEMHIGVQDEAVSDDQGEYSLSIIVHDTDNIKIVIEAAGYQAFEQKLDPFGDRSIDVALVPALPLSIPINEQQAIDIAWQALDPNTSSHSLTAWEIVVVKTITGREVQDLFKGEPVPGGCAPGPTPPDNASIVPDSSYWYVEMQRRSATPQPPPIELYSPTAPPNIPEPIVYQANFLIDAITGQVTARKLFCVIY